MTTDNAHQRTLSGPLGQIDDSGGIWFSLAADLPGQRVKWRWIIHSPHVLNKRRD